MACLVWSVLLPQFFFSTLCNKAKHLSSQLCTVYVSTVITSSEAQAWYRCCAEWHGSAVASAVWNSSVTSSRPSCGRWFSRRAAGLGSQSLLVLPHHQGWSLLNIIRLTHLNLWAILCSRLFFKLSPLISPETVEQVLLNEVYFHLKVSVISVPPFVACVQ